MIDCDDCRYMHSCSEKQDFLRSQGFDLVNLRLRRVAG